MSQGKRDTRMPEASRVAALEHLCGELYQLAGELGAPEAVLDTLAAAASGEPIPTASLLPFHADEWKTVGRRPGTVQVAVTTKLRASPSSWPVMEWNSEATTRARQDLTRDLRAVSA